MHKQHGLSHPARKSHSWPCAAVAQVLQRMQSQATEQVSKCTWLWYNVTCFTISSNYSTTCIHSRVCPYNLPISCFFHQDGEVRLHIGTRPFPPCVLGQRGAGHTQQAQQLPLRSGSTQDGVTRGRKVQWDFSHHTARTKATHTNPRIHTGSSNLTLHESAHVKKQKHILITSWWDSWHQQETGMLFKKKWQWGDLKLCKRRG